MQRTTNKTDQVDAILSADWHLREDQPICRVDDFAAAQWKKVDYIAALQRRYNCPVLMAGDLFNIWRSPLALVNAALKHLPNNFYTIYGNHDLPQHNPALKYKTAIALLEEVGRLTVLPEAHYGTMPTGEPSIVIKGRKILLWHTMVYKGYEPFARPKDRKPNQVLNEFPQFDLILTGHNHKRFTEEWEGRVLVNPGAITRQTAANTTPRPAVYLWNAETNTVKPHFLPINMDAVTRDHIRLTDEKSEQLEAFISKIDSDFSASIDFAENLRNFEAKNPIRKEVLDIIHNAMEA